MREVSIYVISFVIFFTSLAGLVNSMRIKKLNQRIETVEIELKRFVLDTTIYATDCGYDTIVTVEYRK